MKLGSFFIHLSRQSLMLQCYVIDSWGKKPGKQLTHKTPNPKVGPAYLSRQSAGLQGGGRYRRVNLPPSLLCSSHPCRAKDSGPDSNTQLKVFPQPCKRLDCKTSLFLSSSQNRFLRGESNAHLMRIAGVSTPKAGGRAYFHLRSS